MNPATRQTRNRRRRLVRGGIVVVGLALAAGAMAMARPWWPKCILFSATGLHCPGCGLTRASTALLDGDFAQAFAYNAIWPAIFGLFALGFASALRQYVRGNPAPARSKSVWLAIWWPIGFAVLFVAFGILRNLPWEPWSGLAPHRLTNRA